MSNETELLIKLISENKSISEITNAMNLSKRQLFQRMSMLRQAGYLVDRKYHYNGEIKYCLSNPFNGSNKLNSLNIESPQDIQSIRIILTSDSHYGNI